MIDVEKLAEIAIFERLERPDLDLLLKLWTPRTLKAGEVLFRKGDKGSAMFLIEDGIVEIRVPDQFHKREVNVSVLHQGDFFGEISLLDGLPRTASAVAAEDTQLLVMDREDFILFLLQRPAVAVAMLGEVGGRLRATNELVTSLASKNANVEIEQQSSIGERIADRIAEFGGSWAFIIMFLTILFGWMIINTIQLWFEPFDAYPFIFLNLMLSCVAALQAPVIMMSQNRASQKDRLRAELDYQVNLQSELLLKQLHGKMDEVRAEELHALREGFDQLRKQVDDLQSSRERT